MKISLEEGLLDIPQDFAFEIEHHHPFYSDAGTASVPVTLPASDANKAILGYPGNINRAQRFTREMTAFVECGTFRKKCTLLVESAGPEGISASLALQDSELYLAHQDRRLKDIFASRSYGMTKMNIASPYEIYTGVFRDGWYLNDVALFPVACDADPESGNIFVINKPYDGTIIDISRTLTIGDSKVTVPAGYAIAPYIYLWALVQYTFEDLGYTVKVNDLKTSLWLRDIVVIHDLADVCCSATYDLRLLWTFSYRDLVPDMTVGELITWLHDKFGIIVTHDSGEICIMSYCSRVNNTAPTVDLTPYLRGEPTLSYPAPQRLQLEADTDIDGAAPAAESLEDLRKLYANCATAASVDAISGTGLFHVEPLDKYYYSDEDGNVSLLGSAAFPYKRQGDGDLVEYSPEDPYVPMVSVDGVFMPYIGKRSHLYIAAGEAPEDQKMKICYALYNNGTFHGSTTTYDSAGNIKPYVSGSTDPALYKYPSLTPEGLKKAYWNLHEKVLLNGAPTIEAEFDFPVEVLLNSDMYFAHLLRGAQVIIQKMTYSIKDSATIHATALLQLIPFYTDTLLAPSVEFGTAYSWKIDSDRWLYEGDGYEITSTDGLADYTEYDAPSYIPTAAGIRVKVRERWLRYKYTKKVKKWWGVSTSSHTGTYTWTESFVSIASE